MKPEFLSYRYQSLKHVSEILEDATNIGWKCRKSIKWSAIHVEESDRGLLKAAGDDLVENGELDCQHIGRLNEILLNRSKYNRQTQELDRIPKVRKEWERLKEQISLAKEYPGYVYQQIEDMVGSEDLAALGNEEAQEIFSTRCLLQFIQSLRSNCETEFERKIFPAHESDEAKALWITGWFTRVYGEVGLESPESGNPQFIIGSILEDFGLEGTFFSDSGYIYEPSDKELRPENTSITYESGSGDYLMKSVSKGGHQIIKINQNHLFIKQIEGNPEAKKAFELFTQAYFKAREGVNLSDNKFEDFNDLLALKLKSLVRDQ